MKPKILEVYFYFSPQDSSNQRQKRYFTHMLGTLFFYSSEESTDSLLKEKIEFKNYKKYLLFGGGGVSD